MAGIRVGAWIGTRERERVALVHLAAGPEAIFVADVVNSNVMLVHVTVPPVVTIMVSSANTTPEMEAVVP